ncbi:hypothetical protein MUN89_16710 [Halobacillus salinarum]|uniref:Uncharacterized protein n=1 Tax=Halobacillus salinarum TaxID=2932257 RepID=A0ABY4EGD5_9BACI|nr:hypothetical protein [Halobacillus salinarum]UOQ43539.1 hypothetical protein MUN89_16710 [Halobacillus salinarum]
MRQEKIIIEGNVEGMKFSKSIDLAYDPHDSSVEEAILSFYESHACSFEELASERGWMDCYWTFAQPLKSVI